MYNEKNDSENLYNLLTQMAFWNIWENNCGGVFVVPPTTATERHKRGRLRQWGLGFISGMFGVATGVFGVITDLFGVATGVFGVITDLFVVITGVFGVITDLFVVITGVFVVIPYLFGVITDLFVVVTGVFGFGGGVKGVVGMWEDVMGIMI